MTKKIDADIVAHPPSPDEYLPSAIQKAVINSSVKNPLTVYPVALSISCGLVGWLFELPLLYVISIVLFVLGPIWAIILIFFLNERIGSKYLKSLNRKQEKYERFLVKQIKSSLKDCQQIPEIHSYASQAISQIENIQFKYSNVKDLLQMKLRSGEITFGRFLGAAEQVTLSVLDNLKKVVSILKSAGSIQPDYIEERLKVISKKSEHNPEDADQAKALRTRLDLWKNQLNKVNRLIALNEEAMTEMEKISAAVAEWQTDGRFADTDFETAILQLQELAARAYEYNS